MLECPGLRPRRCAVPSPSRRSHPPDTRRTERAGIGGCFRLPCAPSVVNKYHAWCRKTIYYRKKKPILIPRDFFFRRKKKGVPTPRPRYIAGRFMRDCHTDRGVKNVHKAQGRERNVKRRQNCCDLRPAPVSPTHTPWGITRKKSQKYSGPRMRCTLIVVRAHLLCGYYGGP